MTGFVVRREKERVTEVEAGTLIEAGVDTETKTETVTGMSMKTESGVKEDGRTCFYF